MIDITAVHSVEKNIGATAFGILDEEATAPGRLDVRCVDAKWIRRKWSSFFWGRSGMPSFSHWIFVGSGENLVQSMAEVGLTLEPIETIEPIRL